MAKVIKGLRRETDDHIIEISMFSNNEILFTVSDKVPKGLPFPKNSFQMSMSSPEFCKIRNVIEEFIEMRE